MLSFRTKASSQDLKSSHGKSSELSNRNLLKMQTSKSSSLLAHRLPVLLFGLSGLYASVGMYYYITLNEYVEVFGVLAAVLAVLGLCTTKRGFVVVSKHRWRIWHFVLLAGLGLFVFYVAMDTFLPCSSPLWVRYIETAGFVQYNSLQTAVNNACYAIQRPFGLINPIDPSVNLGLHAEAAFALFAVFFAIERVIRGGVIAGVVDSLLAAFGTVLAFETSLRIIAPTQEVCEAICEWIPTSQMTVAINFVEHGLTWVTNALVFDISLPVVILLVSLRIFRIIAPLYGWTQRTYSR